MEVTDLKYKLEDKLVKRLDAFAEMVTRDKQIQDVLFTVHGKTGTGKTNTAVVIAYYLKHTINHVHHQLRDIYLFFRTEEAVEFAKKSSNAIIIIDEPSLDSLSKDQMTKVNKDFQRLINTMRQKRHIVIVNITRFWRFPFDLVVDRSLCMINMNNKDGKDPGRFLYIRQKNLEQLWDIFQKTHKKMFGKLKAFGGRMPERMEKLDDNGKPFFDRMGVIINSKKNCTYQDYKQFRDDSVASIGVSTTKTKGQLRDEDKVIRLQDAIALAVNNISKKYNVPITEATSHFNLPRETILRWQLKHKNQPVLLAN